MKVTIGTPYLSKVEPLFIDSLIELVLELRLNSVKVSRITTDGMNVTYARNKIASKALESDYLLFIDDDMAFEKDLFFKLQEHKKDIVGALTFLRKPPYEPSMYTKHRDGRTFIPNFIWKEGSFIECDAVGMAATLIDCRVFNKMKEDEEYYQDIYSFFDNKFFLGEDFRFCDKAKQKGFKVWCDTSILVDHIAYQGISFGDYAINAIRNLKQKGYEQKLRKKTN